MNRIIKTLIRSAAGFCLLTPSAGIAQVLLIGNSFLLGMQSSLEHFLSDAPPEWHVSVEAVIVLGGSLADHYATSSTLETISGGSWDFIVLEDLPPSFSWLDYVTYANPGESFLDYMENWEFHDWQLPPPMTGVPANEFWVGGTEISDYIVEHTDAQIIYLNTWAVHPDEYADSGQSFLQFLPPGDGQERAARMQDYGARAYLALAAQYPGSVVSPVSAAWGLSYQLHPDLMLHHPDLLHQDITGGYLAAAVLYQTLTGLRAVDNGFDKIPDSEVQAARLYGAVQDLTLETAQTLKDVASAILPVEESWAGYPRAFVDGEVDTGDFLGWINVFYGNYVWSYALNKWMYCPEANVTESGAWVFVPW